MLAKKKVNGHAAQTTEPPVLGRKSIRILGCIPWRVRPGETPLWRVLGMALDRSKTSRHWNLDCSSMAGLVVELRTSAVMIGDIVEVGHGLWAPLPVSAYDVLGSECWPEITRQHVRAMIDPKQPTHGLKQRPTRKRRRRFAAQENMRQGQLVFLPSSTPGATA